MLTEPIVEHRKGDLVISTDRARLDTQVVFEFLTNCYWARGIPKPTVIRSIEHSLCFGIYEGDTQVGFARVITDFATFAYIGDVFVVESHRGRGLAQWLMECIMQHPALAGLRRWALVTQDAHRLYAQAGFTPLAAPERWMERHDPNIYTQTVFE